MYKYPQNFNTPKLYNTPNMSPFIITLLFLLLACLWWFIQSWSNHTHKLPPGPPALPIIGHLHILGTLPHQALHNLAKKYGPIMSIRLGNVPIIVVSSPQAAKLILKTHDTIFASRPKIQASDILSYGTKGMVFTEYGPYWRNIRKFCMLELLSATKIDSFKQTRREEMVLFVGNVRECALKGQVVDVSEKVGGLVEDVTFRMLFGHSTKDGRFDLKRKMQEITDLAGAFNISDFLPILAPLDLQGLTRRLKALHQDLDKTLEMIVEEHEEETSTRSKMLDNDFVDVLLSLLNKSSDHNHADLSNMVDRTTIKGILVDMIAAGIDTSHTSIEWIMSELIRHPRIMKKLQQEIKNVVGVNEIIDENDFTKFKYLDMVIKESYRLHPIVPLLVPRESMEDVVIDGHFVPKKSRVLINTWTIGHDPDSWSQNVNEFLPERFIGKNLDFSGQEFEFLPFGSGRRICPGMQLGLMNVRQIVAQLVHCFDWELPNGLSPNHLNMDEKFGLTLPRAQHLLAMPVLRLPSNS